MLSDHDGGGLLWSGRCDGCLTAIFPFIVGARDVAIVKLVEEGWELRTDGTIWCAECSRRRREVKQHDRRGRRRR